ncbi:MAG: hypothetical protein ABSH21_11085 [Verrucomicrobiia bacterium]
MATFRLQVTGLLFVGWLALSACGQQGRPPTPSPQHPVESLPTMEVAQSVMVTVELDFGAKPPSIAQALREIERRYQPDDGQGRTFAILDAYGEPTTDGKLHISMHVSTEKPGLGALVFRRTGVSLWKTRVVPATHPPTSSFAGKNLFIMLDNEEGKSFLLEESKGATSILNAVVRDTGMPVQDFWPDAAERPVTFFYSACGCPVKVLARRVGDKTVRTKELPVIFPDDPAVAASISRLMGWDSP